MSRKQSEQGRGSSSNDADIEINSKIVRGGPGDTTERVIPVDLHEHDYDQKTDDCEDRRKRPDQTAMRFEGVNVERDQDEAEGNRNEDHEIPDVDQHTVNECHITKSSIFFKTLELFRSSIALLRFVIHVDAGSVLIFTIARPCT